MYIRGVHYTIGAKEHASIRPSDDPTAVGVRYDIEDELRIVQIIKRYRLGVRDGQRHSSE